MIILLNKHNLASTLKNYYIITKYISNKWEDLIWDFNIFIICMLE